MIYKPLKFFVWYIVLTLGVSFYGPRKYLNYDRMSVFIFMMLFLAVFIFGYFKGTKGHEQQKDYTTTDEAVDSIDSFVFTKHRINQMIIVSIYICFIYYTINILTSFVSGQFSLSGSIGQRYLDYHVSKNELGDVKNSFRATPMEIAYLLIGFPRIVVFILGLYYYRFLKHVHKVAFVFTLFLMLFVPVIITGHQKTLGDVVIFGGTIFLIKQHNRIKITFAKVLFSLGTLVLFVIALSYIQISRYESLGIYGFDINEKMIYYTWYDPSHIVYKLFGEKWGLGISFLITGYITCGYYGLSRCLELPFKFTWGSSLFSPFSKIIYRLTGYYGLDDHYVARMAESYDMRGFENWHTLFPYLAGDLTFGGTIILMGFVAYIWGKSWIEILKYRNPYSILMFCQLNLGLIFTPSNNQILWGIDSNIAFWIVLYLWLSRHNSYSKAIEKNMVSEQCAAS